MQPYKPKIMMIFAGWIGLLFTYGSQPQVPAGIDLDVTYIHREPDYRWDAPKMWPDEGETVTFIAHVINKGTVPVGAINFTWTIDGVEVHSGTMVGLNPQQEADQTLYWSWQSGRHQVAFKVDPSNTIPETSETNNQVSDATDALSIGFWVEQSVYDEYNSHLNGAGTYSWEDWAQRIIQKFNWIFEQSTYPHSPNGVLTRVRLDKVTVVPDDTLFYLGCCHAPDDPTVDGRWGFSIQEYQNASQYYEVAWNVIHELGHYLLHRIDLYALNAEGGDVNVLDDSGNRIAGTPLLPYFAWDVVRYVSRRYDIMHVPLSESIYSDHTTYSLNREYPAGRRFHNLPYWYFEDIPADVKIRIIDNSGQPIPNVQVKTYQAMWGDGTSGPYSQNFDNIPDFTGVTNSQGIVSLGGQPFGDIHAWGSPSGVLLIKLVHPITGEISFTWIDFIDMNIGYWQGQTTSYTEDVRFPTGPRRLWVSANSLNFLALKGMNPRPQSINIEMLGKGTQYWNVSDVTVPWLRTLPSPQYGSTDYPPGPLTFAVESSDLPIGNYSYSVDVIGQAGVLDSPKTIQVNLNVIEPLNIYLPLVRKDVHNPSQRNITSRIDDGEVLNNLCQTWSPCRNSSTGYAVWHGLEVGTIGATRTSENEFLVERVFLFFDTFSIPVNAQITRAKLYFHTGPWLNGNNTIHLVQSMATPQLDIYDFSQIRYSSGGSTTPMISNTWWTIELSESALNWITKGGLTKLALIHDYDLNNIAPSYLNDVLIHQAESQYAPYLSIEYR